MFRYPDNANHDLLERIPLSAGVVLDVGCNTGALGAAYRRFNPRARLLGIEKDPVAAERASHRLDQVAVVDVEENPLPFTLDRPIDCIVYGDIIEHLRDPWAVLRQQAEALSDDGTMLICVPNMQHWSFADRLLRGTWKYEPSGLLDETHLRWFSLETVREGLEAAGLVPHDVAPRTFDAAKAQEFASMRDQRPRPFQDAPDILQRRRTLRVGRWVHAEPGQRRSDHAGEFLRRRCNMSGAS